MKLLVAEDDFRNRDMLVRRLRRRGFEILEAADGQEAVDIAFRASPDAILMDLSMPNMSGWEAIRLILSTAPNTQIIVLTANALPDERDHAFAIGACAYLTKPIEFDELMNTLSQLHTPLG